ncbi:hypothetical protein [Modestobacter versicolor]|uniref:Lipoprotein n=1 Tax=Modestobacter versicolor TaxID=429133 RepID=A0A323V938_9ACTN|nr:hypothetical protein [Modestobacter versicolor]MBB3675651.1 hypothetical protein [Modestobacter versicolor]PZA21357.1 hypothetical protein DMO24_10740 [Modestobacter versicolor]
MSRRLLAAVLVAAPVLLGGCGSGNDGPLDAAPSSPSTSSAAPSTSATPTPTQRPVSQWFDAGGEATLAALGETMKLEGLSVPPVDQATLTARCEQVTAATEAAQALPPFPVPEVEAALRGSYPGVLDVAQRCLAEAAAGVQDLLRSGLLVAMVNAYGPFQIARGDAIAALATG